MRERRGEEVEEITTYVVSQHHVMQRGESSKKRGVEEKPNLCRRSSFWQRTQSCREEFLIIILNFEQSQYREEVLIIILAHETTGRREEIIMSKAVNKTSGPDHLRPRLYE